MSVDLLVFAVFLQQSPQDSHTPHPQLLDGHAGVGRTFAFTRTRMTTLSVDEGKGGRESMKIVREKAQNIHNCSDNHNNSDIYNNHSYNRISSYSHSKSYNHNNSYSHSSYSHNNS